MAHAQHVVTLDRPIAEVFAFLADGLNDPAWRPVVTSIEHVSGSGAGARYAQTMRGPGGRSIRGDYTVTGYEPPTRYAFEVTAGPARPTGSLDLRELSPTTTEVTFTMDLKPRGLMVLMSPMIAKQVRAEVSNIDHLETAMAEHQPG